MTGLISALVTPAQQAAFDRDGVVCIRNVLTQQKIDDLRQAVAGQMSGLRSSPTGYDFAALAGQVWDEDLTVDSGDATRFDMQAKKALIKSDGGARPSRRRIHQVRPASSSMMLQPGSMISWFGKWPSIPVSRESLLHCSMRAT